MLYPARFTGSEDQDFKSDADWFIPIMDLAWKKVYGESFEFDEWQKWLIRNILRLDDEGKLAYRQILVSIPRQNGKTEIMTAIALWGLLRKSGTTNIGVASTADQARILQDRLLHIIQNNPSLAKMMTKITEHRGIKTTKGSQYIIRASNSGTLQGIPVALGIVDEVHLVDSDVYTALLNGTGSRQDTLICSITTAGDEDSELLKHLYANADKAIAGDENLSSFGAFIWEAPEDTVPESDEELLDLLVRSNPALEAGRVDAKTFIQDVRSMPVLEIIRYRLNRFVSGESTPPWLSNALFEQAIGEGIVSTGNLIIAVDRTPSWGYVTVAGALKNDQGKFETEIIASFVNPTEEQVFQFLTNLWLKHTPTAFALDDNLMPNIGKKLKDAGIPCWKLWAKEMKAATAHAYWLFSNGMVKHNNDPLLARQIKGAIAKFSGEGLLLSRKESRGDIDSVVATVMALYVASTAQQSTIQVFQSKPINRMVEQRVDGKLI